MFVAFIGFPLPLFFCCFVQLYILFLLLRYAGYATLYGTLDTENWFLVSQIAQNGK